jgi:hypothetical protein
MAGGLSLPRRGAAASDLGARFDVLSSLACCKRLTVPSAVTQDAEKTVVFLYSKLKQGDRAATFARSAAWQML